MCICQINVENPQPLKNVLWKYEQETDIVNMFKE